MHKTSYFTYIKEIFSSKEIFQVVLSFFLFVWVIFIATPFDIVVSNSEEFTFTPGSSILWNGLFYAVLAFLCLMISYAAISLILKSFRKLVFFTAIALSVSAWLNSTFLTGTYGEFDGRGNLQIDPYSLLGWIQIGAFLGVFLFAIYSRNRPKIVIYALASICFISFSTGVINISSKLFETAIAQGDENKLFTYSKTNHNLLIILLDEYQSDYFSEILDDEMKSDLSGFIWFKDAAANFPTTIAAMPAIFSGEIYGNDIDIKEFYDKVSNKSFANRLSDQGFQVSFTQSSPMSETLLPDKSLVTFNHLDPEYTGVYNDLINYTIFRAAPDLIKLKIYNNWKRLMLLENSSPYSSLKSLNYLANKELIVTDGPPTLKFHHSFVTHSPTVLGSSCEDLGNIPSTLQNKVTEGKCAMSKVIQIINNLKNEGVFDNTMIIITADHGSVFQPDSINIRFPYSKASPTLLIKSLKSNSPFQISNALAQLSDIPKTIAAEFDIPNILYPGIDLLSDNKLKDRNRIFNDYNWSGGWSKSRVSPITKYQITGPLNDPKNWKLYKPLIPLPCDATLAFSDVSSNQYYIAGLSQQEAWGRWSDGGQAEIEFRAEPDCNSKSVTFNLKAFVTPKNPEQTASVFINDKRAEDIRISLEEAQPKQFTFALPDAQDNKYIIRFEINKPTTPKSVGVNNETRELSFGFIDMKLLQDEVAAQ